MSTEYRITGRKRLNWAVLAAMASNRPHWANCHVIERCPGPPAQPDVEVKTRAEFLAAAAREDSSLAFVLGEYWIWLTVSKSGNVRYFTRYGRNMAHAFCDELDNQGIGWLSEYDDRFFR